LFGNLAVHSLAFLLAGLLIALYQGGVPQPAGWAGLMLALAGGLVALADIFLHLYRAQLAHRSRRAMPRLMGRLQVERLLRARHSDRPNSTEDVLVQARRASVWRRLSEADTLGLVADLPVAVIALATVVVVAGPIGWVLVPVAGFLAGISYLLSTSEDAPWRRNSRISQGGAATAALEALVSLPAGDAQSRFRHAWDSLQAEDGRPTSARVRAAYMAAMALIFSVLAYFGLAGHLTVGAMAAAGILSGLVLSPICRLPLAVELLLELWDLSKTDRPEQTGPKLELRGELEVKDLVDPTGLHVSALHVRPGERIAILDIGSPSAEALFNGLSGQASRQSGMVWVDGVGVHHLPKAVYSRDIGYLHASTPVFEGTLRDNLRVGDDSDERLMAALDFAGLGQKVRSHPLGLDMDIRDPSLKGSGAAVGWVWLWLQDPNIVFLCQPRVPSSSKAATARIDAWLAGRTVIALTDRGSFLRSSTRIIVALRGQIIMDGPADEVMAQLQTGAPKDTAQAIGVGQ
ncbi:MAG: hypothetical protein AAFV38_05675, partial [Pseudomonadota bacterium]